jgi:hypothetical protein
MTLADLYTYCGATSPKLVVLRINGVDGVDSMTLFGYLGYYAGDQSYNYEFERPLGVSTGIRQCWAWSGRSGSVLVKDLFSISDMSYCPITRNYVNQ